MNTVKVLTFCPRCQYDKVIEEISTEGWEVLFCDQCGYYRQRTYANEKVIEEYEGGGIGSFGYVLTDGYWKISGFESQKDKEMTLNQVKKNKDKYLFFSYTEMSKEGTWEDIKYIEKGRVFNIC